MSNPNNNNFPAPPNTNPTTTSSSARAGTLYKFVGGRFLPINTDNDEARDNNGGGGSDDDKEEEKEKVKDRGLPLDGRVLKVSSDKMANKGKEDVRKPENAK